MKAAQYNSYGGPNVIEINPDAPTPPLKENQVLIAVRASSINPFDVKLRKGFAQESRKPHFPFTIGDDFAGIIKEIGKSVTAYHLGDEVFGSALVLNGGSGSFAELATANTKNIAFKPTKADFLASAASVLVGASAVQALEEHIKLQKGKKILIHGGAGGIGSIAIQLAKSHGAYVATTVSTDDIAFAQQMGADEVIDYKTQRFEEVCKDFDAVFDTVGGETTDRSFLVLKKGGVLVSMADQPNEELTKKYAVTAIVQNTHTNNAHLTRVAELIDQGKIKPQVTKVFSLDEVREAFIYFETHHPRGKVAIQIKA